MAKFNVKIKSDIEKELKKIKDFELDESLNKLGIVAIETINNRIDKGVDVDGKRFKKYSQQYSKKKKASGRRAKPDLQFTGEMLNSMTHTVTNNKMTIQFPKRNHKKSKSSIEDIARENNETREFFSLSDKELNDALEKTVYKDFREVLNG